MTEFDLRQTLNRRTLPSGIDPRKGIAALCGPRPTSIRALTNLPPKTVVFDSGPLSSGTAHGNCQLSINSDGFWSFKGEAHENGIVGDNYVIGLALLDLKDSVGATFAAIHGGTVHGTLAPGEEDDKWEGVRGFEGDCGFDQRIADQWDIVVNSGTRSTMHTATNAGDVIGAVFEGIIIGAVAIFLASPGTTCATAVDENGNPELRCSNKPDGQAP